MLETRHSSFVIPSSFVILCQSGSDLHFRIRVPSVADLMASCRRRARRYILS